MQSGAPVLHLTVIYMIFAFIECYVRSQSIPWDAQRFLARTKIHFQLLPSGLFLRVTNGNQRPKLG